MNVTSIEQFGWPMVVHVEALVILADLSSCGSMMKLPIVVKSVWDVPGLARIKFISIDTARAALSGFVIGENMSLNNLCCFDDTPYFILTSIV